MPKELTSKSHFIIVGSRFAIDKGKKSPFGIRLKLIFISNRKVSRKSIFKFCNLNKDLDSFSWDALKNVPHSNICVTIVTVRDGGASMRQPRQDWALPGSA